MTSSPRLSSKRIKLESSPSTPRLSNDASTLNDEDLGDDHCVICLQPLVDRTVIPTCSHEFCFECISIWAEQSRKCPLCSQLIGEYIIHHIRSQFDYQKHYLPPPRSSSPQLLPDSDRHDADELERAIAKRRWIYQNHLYAKHVASNSFTRYRPYPSPAQFAASLDMMSRATIFLRRELRVWPNLDVEFLTTFIISLMKSIDIRAESSIKLLAEFLDLDTSYIEGQRHPNAEHFAHEIYCYIRSGRDLSIYDTLVQILLPLSRKEITGGVTSPVLDPGLLITVITGPKLDLDLRYLDLLPQPCVPSTEDLLPRSTVRRTLQIISPQIADIADENLLDDAQEQLMNKSAKVKGKEPERNHTPLRGGSEHYSSSTPPRTSVEFVPNAVVEPQQIAESYTSGNKKLSTPPVESGPKHTLVAPASKAPVHVPVDIKMIDVNPEPAASTSRKRPSTLGRPPRNRTLLASVQAHLSQPTTSRSKHHANTNARKNEATPQYLPHPSRPARDTRDGGGGDTPALLSRLPSPPSNAPPASLSSHSSLGRRSDASTPLGGENTPAVGNQGLERVRSLSADPITKGTDEENLFAGGKVVVRPCSTPNEGTNKNRTKEEQQHTITNATSPSSIIAGVYHASLSRRAPNPNPISSPHNSNHVDFLWDVAEHSRRGNQEVATCTYANKITAPSVHTSTDMRVVLLQRLEEEQQLAQRDASTSTSHSTSPPTTSPLGEETSALETRLRTRALLRVRLAAIKNASNTTLVET
ncbi:uncharacterized protein EDB91DRAFT_1257568 [Suillus paluster]|uniref:uncharacterized protein n=1 Tax=Suillus paluster TaxID=48578 RepID=UPI001B8817E5|nr:uncharacterized protein EDB91DRAFT_1257568 [Suillus paluster]KAG1719560.1 hypothetical protein EDB91DRAFT_1257568 [Suillus paluster]